MGSCLSTSKVTTGSSSQSNNNNQRENKPSTTITTVKKQQQQQEKPRKHLQQPKGKGNSKLPNGVVACGKRTDFGYDKDFDSKYSIGKLLGHGQFGYTYVATDRASGDRVAVKKIEKNKVFWESGLGILCFSFFRNLESWDGGRYDFYDDPFRDFCNWVGIYVNSRFLFGRWWIFFSWRVWMVENTVFVVACSLISAIGLNCCIFFIISWLSIWFLPLTFRDRWIWYDLVCNAMYIFGLRLSFENLIFQGSNVVWYLWLEFSVEDFTCWI